MRDEKLYFYDTIADRFDEISNQYDTERRLEIVFDEMLATHALDGRAVLDVGCGSGRFSARAVARGARVTSLDVGVQLLRRTRERCGSSPVAADACRLPLASDAFDVVISSECIEHTLDPVMALHELYRVTRPGGWLLVTVPNQVWHFAVTFAAVFKLRPFEGYEHWLRWRQLRQELQRAGARIEVMRGFHLVPPLVRASQPLLRRLDAFGGTLGPVMLNIAVLARKPAVTPPPR